MMRNVFLVLLAAFAFTSTATAQRPAWADKLFDGKTIHDFGVVPHGVQLKTAFRLTNIYRVPLDVTEVRVSCDCVKAVCAKNHLLPGESADLNVEMDGKRFSGQKTVRIYVKVGPTFVSTATLTVSALTRGDVVFNPTELDFNIVQHGKVAAKLIDVEYAGGQADWRVTEIVKSANAPFELKVEELVRPRRGYRIISTIKPDAPAGSFKQEVTLKTNDPVSPVLKFNIVGTIQAGMAITPNPILVNGFRLGESQTKKIFVRGARPFRIIGVEGQGEGVTVEIAKNQERQDTQVLTVHIQPMRAGELRRQLLIRTDLGTETATLTVEGTIEP
jgi:hypothetical protein